MTPEEFRAAGHVLIDWIADHRAGIEARPVRAQVEPGDVARALPTDPPTATVAIDHLVGLLDDVVVPGTTLVQHPMHFGWFPSNASLASVLGDIASSGLGGLGISWESCPALTEVEEVVCDWLRQLVGLSDAWSGTIQDTASTACLTALLAARERATDHLQASGGLAALGRSPAIYTTDQAHSSVRKAALLAGFGADRLRVVATDPRDHAMVPTALDDAIAADVAEGVLPVAVVVSVGTTGTTAFDPVDRIVEIASRHRAWVHVDAAMAGSAMLVPEMRHLWHGVEGADSISWNPHKWMGTILDTSLFYVRDVEHLVRVMSTNPSYLRSSVDDEVTQFRDWGIPLGRRFRALKLLFHIEIDGIEAIRERIRRDLQNARWLADRIEESDDWELLAPVALQTVCVRHRPAALTAGGGHDDIEGAIDRHNRAWVETLNRSGRAFLTPAQVGGRWLVRVSVGVETTERRHVEQLWELMRSTAAEAVAVR